MRRIFIIVTSIVHLVKSAARTTLDSVRSVAYNPHVLAMCKSPSARLNLVLDREETELAVAASQIALSSPHDFLSEGYCQAVAPST